MVFTLVVNLELKDAKDAQKMKDKLVELAAIYKKDEGTLDWFVHEDAKDPKKYCIIERYEAPDSIKVHRANPAYKTFGPFLEPLLAKPYEISMLNELTGKL